MKYLKQTLKRLKPFLTIPVIFISSHLIFRSTSLVKPVIVSHRGAAGLAPENTLAAIRKALEHKADFIEIDVHRSADKVLIVMHDQTVDRTTNGTGTIKDLTASEINSLDVQLQAGSAIIKEPVPTFDSALELVSGSSSNLVLEIKKPHRYPGIEYQVAEIIQKFEAQDRIIVISFDHEWLNKFNALMPKVSLGYLSIYPLKIPQTSAPKWIDVFWTSVIFDPTLVRRIHNRGHHVWVWTVDNPLIMRLLIWLGVDGITTNRPDVLNKVISPADK